MKQAQISSDWEKIILLLFRRLKLLTLLSCFFLMFPLCSTEVVSLKLKRPFKIKYVSALNLNILRLKEERNEFVMQSRLLLLDISKRLGSSADADYILLSFVRVPVIIRVCKMPLVARSNMKITFCNIS